VQNLCRFEGKVFIHVSLILEGRCLYWIPSVWNGHIKTNTILRENGSGDSEYNRNESNIFLSF